MSVALRLRAVTAVVLAGSSCVGEAPVVESLGQEVVILRAAASAPGDGEEERGTNLRDTGKRARASKTLAAIALERVTGRKPDPIRLMD
jgi:hypothetical protein